MRKIDYSRIKWDAATNWEFCGSKENLKEVWNRASECRGVRTSVEEFGYSKPSPGLTFEKGDVVVYVDDDEITSFAVVDIPLSDNGYFYIRLPDGHQVRVHPRELAVKVKIADIPDELMALARAEAGKPLDLSKCPLKNVGACMKGDEA